MHSSTPTLQRDTRAWQFQVWASFAIAVFLCATGLAWLPGERLEVAFMFIRTRDSDSFNRLHAEQLLYLPGVRQVRLFMVLRNVLSTTELPLAV